MQAQIAVMDAFQSQNLQILCLLMPEDKDLYIFYHADLSLAVSDEIIRRNIQPLFPAYTLYVEYLKDAQKSEQLTRLLHRPGLQVLAWKTDDHEAFRSSAIKTLQSFAIEVPHNLFLVNLGSVQFVGSGVPLEQIMGVLQKNIRLPLAKREVSIKEAKSRTLEYIRFACESTVFLHEYFLRPRIQRGYRQKRWLKQVFPEIQIYPDQTWSYIARQLADLGGLGDDLPGITYTLNEQYSRHEGQSINLLEEAKNRIHKVDQDQFGPMRTTFDAWYKAFKEIEGKPAPINSPGSFGAAASALTPILFEDDQKEPNGTYLKLNNSSVAVGKFNHKKFLNDFHAWMLRPGLFAPITQAMSRKTRKIFEDLSAQDYANWREPIQLENGRSVSPSSFVRVKPNGPIFTAEPAPRIFKHTGVHPYSPNPAYACVLAGDVWRISLEEIQQDLLTKNALLHPELSKRIESEMHRAYLKSEEVQEIHNKLVFSLSNLLRDAKEPRTFRPNAFQSLCLQVLLTVLIIGVELSQRKGKLAAIQGKDLYIMGDQKAVEETLTELRALPGMSQKPQPAYLIAKGAYDMIELTSQNGKIRQANGAWLNFKDNQFFPLTTTPHIIDKTLSYMIVNTMRTRKGEPFEPTLDMVKNYMNKIISSHATTKEKLQLFAWNIETDEKRLPCFFFDDSGSCQILNPVNRLFVIRPGSALPYTGKMIHVEVLMEGQASKKGKKLFANQEEKIKKAMVDQGLVEQDETGNLDLVSHAITGIPFGSKVVVENRNFEREETSQQLLKNIHLNFYAYKILDAFKKWNLPA